MYTELRLSLDLSSFSFGLKAYFSVSSIKPFCSEQTWSAQHELRLLGFHSMIWSSKSSGMLSETLSSSLGFWTE